VKKEKGRVKSKDFTISSGRLLMVQITLALAVKGVYLDAA
jgi:hypothetical protein